MVFPTTPLDVKVELQLNGTWTDVTAYVYIRSPITITRGRQDEDGRASPGKSQLMLNNRDGRFSPRNPTGPYYGTLGRNTPVRASARLGPTRLTGFASSFTPDSAGVSITGDLDIRVEQAYPSWSTTRDIIAKNAASHSYRLQIQAGAFLTFLWSPDGVTEPFATSTVPLPVTTGRQAVRATIDVDNGAAGRTITFYYAPTIAGPWTQLGDPVVQAGVTSIFDSADTFKVLNYADGQTFAAELRQGIGGTVRANPDWTIQAEGATSFVDGVGNTWTVVAGASVTNRRYRAYDEISAWPQAWDLSQKDVWVPVEASGIIRRLGQSDPLLGPIQRGVIRNISTTFAYWPMEDDSNSTSIASGLPGGPPMTISGTPQLAANDSLFAASGALPVTAGASFTGAVSPYTASGFVHLRCLLGIPATGETVNGVIARVYTTGTAARWDLVYTGGLTLNAYDSLGALLFSQAVGFTVLGQRLIAGIEMTQNGANVDWHMFTVDYYNNVGLGFSGTLATNTVGAATVVQMNANSLLTSTVIGHVALQSIIPAAASFTSPLRGWAGETAGRRAERLCSEESIAFQAYGDLDQSVAMGVQPAGTILDLLTECETTDLGQVFENREALGLAYRTRDSRQYQTATLALAYNNLSELTPVEDDQSTRNDITASRVGGSSARITVDTGTLSTQAPPNGVGRYAETVDLSLSTDSQCGDQAQWRATAGTIDEPRYPAIVAHLEVPAFTARSTLLQGALDVDHGDLITITGTPAWLPPDTVRQHAVGQVETLGVYSYEIDFVCAPATPAGATGLYDVTGRYSPSGSTLTAGITSAATSFQITTAAGNPLWTTAGADFPLDVVFSGERITLSGISGTSSPQTATVSARAVNGVVKAHSAGEAIDIYDATYYSF